ncbi:hypothetical protein BDB00DRAFT_824496 [Zychaea mexicana]|uniref:uncharacterized protein n=1 Tax=Zychaea mexicana TaxID=64656 RepID=UPI0022FE751E|nr:uncharacterized protein BDB00DRAFT_824496 [Zychaea mexicana]KAI9493123.1 hypothetical protein BDB00DRAFT_824496 [Zychaea mexicana]
MRARVFWLAFFRFILLILSLAALACHIANIVLLTKQDDSGPWFPEHIPYVLYFVGPGVSVICSIALNMVSMSNVKSIRGDRTMGILNLALMIAVIVYNTLEGGVFPWIGGHDEDGPTTANRGFAAYCMNWAESTTQYRCWLTDGVWLGCILIAAFWLFLIIFVYAQKSSDIYDDDYDVYDFKEDVPMAVTSSKNEPAYHASSPTSNQAPAPSGGNYYSNQGNYQEYESYYDYPPQSPYAGYKQPASAAGGYAGGYGYTAAAGGPATTGYAQDDTVHILSDAGQPQYYSPHLNTGSSAPGAAGSSPHIKAQTPNAY